MGQREGGGALSEGAPRGRRLEFPGALATRYQPEGILGSGAMGAVFRAIDRELGRRVAIKLLSLAPSPELLSRMQREARVMGQIRHPGVIEVYDFGLVEGRPFLVMELLDGKDLSLLPPGTDPLPPMLEVARALGEVHRHGVLHRDVKPPNIFLTGSGRAVLTDFGLASDPSGEGLTRTGMVVGSPAYLSPEVLTGQGQDSRADWWAWAVTLFQLQEGRLPFPMEVVFGMGRDEQSEAAPSFHKLADETQRRLLLRCLSPDPDRRPGSWEEIQALLECAPGAEQQEEAEGDVASGRFPPQREARSESGMGRRRWLPRVALLVSVLVSLLALSLGMLLPQPVSDRAGGAERAGERHSPALQESPLGSDFARLVRQEVEFLGRRYRSPEGQEAGFQGETPPESWTEVLSLDPAGWGELVARMQSLQRFRDWQHQGGRPEHLPEATRGELRGLGEVFRGQGLPDPFDAFLRLQPSSEPVPFPAEWDHLRMQFHLPPGGLLGWRGTALQALISANQRYQEMLAALQAAYLEQAPYPAELPVEQLSGIGIVTAHNVAAFQKELWHQASARRTSGSWSYQLGRHVHLALLAASHALRECEPTEALEFARFTSTILNDLTWWSFTHLGRLDWRWMLVGEPETGGEWWLAYTLWGEQLALAAEFTWPSDELLARTRLALQNCLVTSRVERAPDTLLAYIARYALFLEYRHGLSAGLLGAYRQGRENLLWYEPRVLRRDIGPLVLWAARLQAAEEEGPLDSELVEVLGWYQGAELPEKGLISPADLQELLTWAAQRVREGS